MKRSIINYYDRKFEACSVNSFAQSFNTRELRNRESADPAYNWYIAAMLLVGMLAIGKSYFDNSAVTPTEMDIHMQGAAQASDEEAEFQFPPVREEFKHLSELDRAATENSTFLEADLSELIAALDKIEATIPVEEMNIGEQLMFFNYRANLSLRDSNIEQAIAYYEILVGLDVPADIIEVFQKTLDRIRNTQQGRQ